METSDRERMDGNAMKAESRKKCTVIVSYILSYIFSMHSSILFSP